MRGGFEDRQAGSARRRGAQTVRPRHARRGPVRLRTRTPEEVRDIVKAARADLWPAIEAGKLSLPIDKTFPLSQAAEALAHMKANAHFGKIVLVV